MDQFIQLANGFVRVQAGAAVYADSAENFAADYGEAAPALPDGATERIYEPNRRHAIIADDCVIAGGALPWEFGDDAIAAIGSLLAAQTLRIGEPSPQPSTPNIINVQIERARRLAMGFEFDFGDARGVHRIGTTAADMAGWDEVTKFSQAMIALGQSAPIQIVTDTGPVEVTPQEWQVILIAAGAFRQPIWAASFALQTMDPIPADYADDIYWP